MQFGPGRPNWSARSSRPVRMVPRWLDRSDRSLRPIRPVRWWLAQRHNHSPHPSSAASSRIDELANFDPPYTTKSYGEPPFPPAMPQDIWDDLIKTNPHYATQTMSTTNPMTHRLSASGQTSTGNYEADLTRMKEDPANMFKSKLVLDVGRSRLYRRPYADAFDLVPYPTSWRVPDFIKFSGDDNRSTWEHISQCMVNLGKLVLITLCVSICFLCH